ncbi:MAG: hypothetical protein EPN72_12060 [Nevskiaceae bacterium]|nr:MAG: hypothetical protein EPN63_00915 [Nevskiaceae bacterium]TBR71921.1 MAG: hypothetical protein EPN72_12060 [Nevskiaceae bacterium]
MHGRAFAPTRGTAEPTPCFRAQAPNRKRSNPLPSGNTKAGLRGSGKTQSRLSGLVGIRGGGLPHEHKYGKLHRQMNTIDCSPIERNRLSSWFSKGNLWWRRNTHWPRRYGPLGKRAA